RPFCGKSPADGSEPGAAAEVGLSRGGRAPAQGPAVRLKPRHAGTGLGTLELSHQSAALSSAEMSGQRSWRLFLLHFLISVARALSIVFSCAIRPRTTASFSPAISSTSWQ